MTQTLTPGDEGARPFWGPPFGTPSGHLPTPLRWPQLFWVRHLPPSISGGVGVVVFMVVVVVVGLDSPGPCARPPDTGCTGAFKHHQNSTRRTPSRDTKRAKWWWERKKKAQNFGPPTKLRGPHPSGCSSVLFFAYCCSVFCFRKRRPRKTKTPILAKVGLARMSVNTQILAKVGQLRLAKSRSNKDEPTVGLANPRSQPGSYSHRLPASVLEGTRPWARRYTHRRCGLCASVDLEDLQEVGRTGHL